MDFKKVLYIGIQFFLAFGVVVVMAIADRNDVMSQWSERRCEPSVVASSALYKPASYTGTAAQYANENFEYCQKQIITDTLRTATIPLRVLQRLQTQMVESAGGGLGNIWSVFGNLQNIFMEMVSSANRRTIALQLELRRSFAELMSVMNRVGGILLSSVFAGIGVITSMLTTLRLVIMIVIIMIGIIMGIIAIMFIFMWPFIGWIAGVVAAVMVTVITIATAIAAAVSRDSMCLHPDTLIRCHEGDIPAKDIVIGTVLADGLGSVTGVLHFKTEGNPTPMYSLYEAILTGEHLALNPDGIPILVSEHPHTIQVSDLPPYSSLYCFITESHRIPLVGGATVFDWEELEETGTHQSAWYHFVYHFLNNQGADHEVNESKEAALAANTQVVTKDGKKYISVVKPGESVLDTDGHLTTVLGIVKLHHSEVGILTNLNGDIVSTGCWIFGDNKWDRAISTTIVQRTEDAVYYHLITDSGTFITSNGTRLRDFTDIGVDNLEKTYPFVKKMV